MTYDYISVRMRESFEIFAHHTPTSALAKVNCQELTLGNFIVTWLRDGDGVEACCANFETYLIGVVAIIEDWRHDPELLHYSVLKPGRTPGSTDHDDYETVERSADELFGTSEHSPTRLLLDRDFFNACVWKHTHGEDSLHVHWTPN